MNPSMLDTKNSTVFLDANILLEIILERKHQTIAKELLSKKDVNLNISALSAHLIMYFGQKKVGLPILRQFLGDYTILPLEAADFDWAFINIRNNDFEDALQLAVAIRNGCANFITFDKPLVETYGSLKNISVNLLS
jgi:predicted nucleic acid-binding protein